VKKHAPAASEAPPASARNPAVTPVTTPATALEEEILDREQLKKKTVAGAMSYFARTLFLNGIGLAANMILGALLLTSDYGVYAVVVNIIGVLTFFSDIGLASALIQSKKKPTDEDYQTIFWVQMSLAGLIVICCLVIQMSGLFASQLGETGGGILLALGASFVFAALKTVPSIKLTRSLSFSKLVWPQIVEQVVFNGVLIALVVAGRGVASYIPAIWARSVAGTLCLLLIMPYWPKLVFSGQSFKNNVRYGIKFQLNDFLARVKDQFFYLTVSKVVTLEEFGMIGFSKNWSMYPYNLTVQNVLAITFPTFSRLQKNLPLLRRALEKSIFFITLAIFPILTAMCVLFWPITVVIPDYTKWMPTTLTFILFTLSIAPAAISTPLTNVLNATGRVNSTLKLMLFWTGLTWLLTFPLLTWLGFDGVAVAALLISLTSFLPVWLVKKVVPFNLWDNIWRQLLACVLMALVGWAGLAWAMRGLGEWLAVAAAMALTYGGAWWLVGSKKLKVEISSLGIGKRKEGKHDD
jgi:O-antigen/teichoic acid export membrane protein